MQRLGIAADGGQRGAQLVADVGQQVALDPVELLQLAVHPVEVLVRAFEVGDGAREEARHVVEGVAQGLELVARLQGDAVAEVAAGQLAGAADQLLDRPQALPRKHEGEGEAQGEAEEAEREDPAEKLAERPLEAAVVEAEEHRILVAAPLLDVGHDHQEAAVALQLAFPPHPDVEPAHGVGQAAQVALRGGRARRARRDRPPSSATAPCRRCRRPPAHRGRG